MTEVKHLDWRTLMSAKDDTPVATNHAAREMDMDTSEIQSRVNTLSEQMLAKGMRSPSAVAMLKSNAEPCVHFSWADKNQTYGASYDSFHAETLAAAFDKAVAFIAARPSAEQANFNEFMGALGKVIDLGRSNNIEVDFLNPLVATMKRLSENAITNRAAS